VSGARFARWVFIAAGLYGVVTLPPLYFMERMADPPIAHPEHYYGFVGTALAFQVLFLTVARDPERFRPAMPACMLEKATFVVALTWLYLQGRLPMPLPVFAAIDLMWLGLFVAAWLKTAPKRALA
jgi:hypothetical protein